MRHELIRDRLICGEKNSATHSRLLEQKDDAFLQSTIDSVFNLERVAEYAQRLEGSSVRKMIEGQAPNEQV